MSFPPITIPDLDPASPLDPDNDLLLIRQGLTDKKVLLGMLQKVNLASLPMLSGQLTNTDVLMVGRPSGGGGYDNYLMPPQYLGFLNGTCAWFWQATAPLGWSVVPNSGDKVLATVLPGGQSYQYTATGYQGDWQQDGHALTVDEMPEHRHRMPLSQGSADNFSSEAARAGKTASAGYAVATYGVLEKTSSTTAPHNHGNEWRPEAAVGILCVKDKLIGE